MVRWIILAVLALPAAELIVFILIAAGIGFLRALALQIVLSTVGYYLLRGAGTGSVIHRMSPSGYAQAMQFDASTATAARSLAGLLLLIPGFISDIAGAALLLPPVRSWIARRIRAVMPNPAGHGGSGHEGAQSGGSVVDLERGDWRRIDETPPGPERHDTGPAGGRD